jgi:hypothetical protein
MESIKYKEKNQKNEKDKINKRPINSTQIPK